MFLFCPQHPQEPSESDPSEKNLGDPMPTTHPLEYLQQVVEDEEESYGYADGNDGISVASSPQGLGTFSIPGSDRFVDSDNEPVATAPSGEGTVPSPQPVASTPSGEGTVPQPHTVPTPDTGTVQLCAARGSEDDAPELDDAPSVPVPPGMPDGTRSGLVGGGGHNITNYSAMRMGRKARDAEAREWVQSQDMVNVMVFYVEKHPKRQGDRVMTTKLHKKGANFQLGQLQEYYLKKHAQTENFKELFSDSDICFYDEPDGYIPLNMLKTFGNLRDEQGEAVVLYARVKDGSAAAAVESAPSGEGTAGEDLADFEAEVQAVSQFAINVSKWKDTAVKGFHIKTGYNETVLDLKTSIAVFAHADAQMRNYEVGLLDIVWNGIIWDDAATVADMGLRPGKTIHFGHHNTHSINVKIVATAPSGEGTTSFRVLVSKKEAVREIALKIKMHIGGGINDFNLFYGERLMKYQDSIAQMVKENILVNGSTLRMVPAKITLSVQPNGMERTETFDDVPQNMQMVDFMDMAGNKFGLKFGMLKTVSGLPLLPERWVGSYELQGTTLIAFAHGEGGGGGVKKTIAKVKGKITPTVAFKMVKEQHKEEEREHHLAEGAATEASDVMLMQRIQDLVKNFEETSKTDADLAFKKAIFRMTPAEIDNVCKEIDYKESTMKTTEAKVARMVELMFDLPHLTDLQARVTAIQNYAFTAVDAVLAQKKKDEKTFNLMTLKTAFMIYKDQIEKSLAKGKTMDEIYRKEFDEALDSDDDANLAERLQRSSALGSAMHLG